MTKLIAALCLTSALAMGTASAQPFTPNPEGVTMGHWHMNSADVQSNKKLFTAMGGTPNGPTDRIQNVRFPGVVVNLNPGAASPPPTGGSRGTVVNHVGFTVPNVQEAMAKWKAAGVPVEPGNNGRLDQAYVNTPDGLRIEILENKSQKFPVQHEHVHFSLPEALIPQSQAWYGKIFGAKAGKNAGGAPIADIPGTQLRFAKADMPQITTKGRVLDHIGFDIKDLQGFIKNTLEPNGIKLDRPYTKQDNGGALAFITDPWGTYIELNERPNPQYIN
jgi:catechol 2,3-dioxygenase-like lactoylglutathione lyase family enzyme/extradiol dioxygenase family protein